MLFFLISFHFIAFKLSFLLRFHKNWRREKNEFFFVERLRENCNEDFFAHFIHISHLFFFHCLRLRHCRRRRRRLRLRLRRRCVYILDCISKGIHTCIFTDSLPIKFNRLNCINIRFKLGDLEIYNGDHSISNSSSSMVCAYLHTGNVNHDMCVCLWEMRERIDIVVAFIFYLLWMEESVLRRSKIMARTFTGKCVVWNASEWKLCVCEHNSRFFFH